MLERAQNPFWKVNTDTLKCSKCICLKNLCGLLSWFAFLIYTEKKGRSGKWYREGEYFQNQKKKNCRENEMEKAKVSVCQKNIKFSCWNEFWVVRWWIHKYIIRTIILSFPFDSAMRTISWASCAVFMVKLIHDTETVFEVLTSLEGEFHCGSFKKSNFVETFDEILAIFWIVFLKFAWF